MLNEAKVEKGKRYFKFFHLKGLHNPIDMNEKLEYVKMKINRKNLKIFAKGVIKILHLFLKKIKSLGIFKQSMIFIVADHGNAWGSYGLKIPEGFSKGDVSKKQYLQKLWDQLCHCFFLKVLILNLKN